MKKSIICLLGLSFVTLACTREQNPAQYSEEETSFSIVAKITEKEMADVKTDYDEFYANPRFSWLNGDMIAVQLEERENAGKYNQHKFTTTGGDASATFTATSGLNVTTYKLSTYAFYPRHNSYENGRDILYSPSNQDVYFNPVATVPKDELKSIVPLIGTRDSGTADNATTDVLYNFKTLTGVMRLSLKNVPSTARKIKVTSAAASAYLSGYAKLTNISDGELAMSDFANYLSPDNPQNTKTIVFGFIPTEGEDLIIYVPIPTGELTGGFKVEILGEGDAEILSRSVSADITIERNKIYFAPDITFDAGWRSIGTGYFGDCYLFALTGFVKAGCMAPVDIQRNTSNTNQYRIRDPYGVAAKALGVTLSGFHNSYLTFTVAGASITFENHKSGIKWNNHNTMLVDNNSANDVVSYQGSGVPKLIRLSPLYKYDKNDDKAYGDNLSNRSSYKNVISIVFPGVAIGEALAADWAINGDTMTIEAIDDVDYNIQISHYVCPTMSFDDDGVCKGTYDPTAGTIVFPQLQQFADTGEKWSSSDAHNGSAIAYSFRAKNVGVSMELKFEIGGNNVNGYWKPSYDTYGFDKWVVDYGNTSGYLGYRQFNTSEFTLQRQ